MLTNETNQEFFFHTKIKHRSSTLLPDWADTPARFHLAQLLIFCQREEDLSSVNNLFLNVFIHKLKNCNSFMTRSIIAEQNMSSQRVRTEKRLLSFNYVRSEGQEITLMIC